MNPYKSRSTDPQKWNKHLSLIPSQSGRIKTADFDKIILNNDSNDMTQCYATIISFGQINDVEYPDATTATIVYELADGKVGFLESARPGIQYVVGKCRRILSDGNDRDGNTLTTTANNINWQGGEY